MLMDPDECDANELCSYETVSRLQRLPLDPDPCALSYSTCKQDEVESGST